MKARSPKPAKPVIKQPPTLFPQTQQIVQRLQKHLGGRFISYWNSHRGSVCHNDVLATYELLEGREKTDTIYLFIKSDGGNGQAALRLINLLRQNCDRLVALVPLNCASAATMIALGADEICMGPMAYLTAVDTSLTHDLSPVDRDNDRVSVSLDELKRVVRLWDSENNTNATNPYHALLPYVHPLVIGAVDRADSLSVMICKELLATHMKNASAAEKIAVTLNSKYPSHSFPILLDEARRIGLKASRMDADTHLLLLQLNELYSEMGQKATTDFDQYRSHSNEILNLVEINGRLVFYQQDKDWFYRNEERRWITMNDQSSWRKIEQQKNRTVKSILHIS